MNQVIFQKAYQLLKELNDNDFYLSYEKREEIRELFAENPLKFKLFEESDTNTGIDWWNKNREKINVVVRLVNKWQLEEAYDERKGVGILAEIEYIRKKHPRYDDKELSDWQYDILDEIESFVKEQMEEN